jgi:phage protein D/phage baseplate assembly protein gpV
MGIGALADLLGGGGGAADTGLPPATQRTIKIDGVALDDAVDEQVVSVTVIDRLRMPDSFVLVFRDPGHDVLSTAGIEIGGKVEISTSEPGADEAETLFSGEVTSIEAEYDLLGVRAVVRGYDLLHRLTAGRKTKTYENVTYADVAKEIADGAGLDADVGDSGGTVDHVIQPNVSDLDFLYQLAGRAGFDVGIDDDKLTFKEPAKAGDAPGKGDPESTKATQLVWSHNLLEFRARMSAVAQVTEVKVRGWDVEAKEAVIGQADAETDSASLSMSPADLADAVGGETLVVVDRPVGDQGAADDLAKAIAQQVASAAYEATAVAVGSPQLKAGVAVSISEVDPALAGDWVITTARHEFGRGPYRTHLEFSGRQDRSLHGLVSGGLAVPATRTSIPGVVVGIVTDNDDPDGLGRVKVKYPWLADDAESYWARLARPSAGEDYGFLWVPESGEEVLVAFEQGDIAYPFVVGSLWNGKAKPPSKVMDGIVDSDGKVVRHALVSPAGHRLTFYDADDDSGIVLRTEDKTVRIVLGQSDARMKLYCDGDKLEIETTGDLTLKADGAIKIEAGKTLDLKASQNATLKGAKVAIN